MRLSNVALGALAVALASIPVAGHAAVAQNDAAPSSAVGAADQLVSFEMFLPLTHGAELDRLLQQQTDPNSPNFRHWLTPAQFKERFGPSKATLAQVRQILASGGLSVVGEHEQSLTVAGRMSKIEAMFKTRFRAVTNAAGVARMTAATPMQMPAALQAMGAKVINFHPKIRAHVNTVFRQMDTKTNPKPVLQNRDAAVGPYRYNDLREAYAYPAFNAIPTGFTKPITGAGVQIGVIMASPVLLGDPNDQSVPNDIQMFFDEEQFTVNAGVPAPTVRIQKVLGGSGPFDATKPEAAEATLNVQQALGSAPGAGVVLYDIPDLSTEAILAGYFRLVSDNLVSVSTVSFGTCELLFTPPYNPDPNGGPGLDLTYQLQLQDSLFKQGNAQGITFVAASGDQAALACPDVANWTQGKNGKFTQGVIFPASSPNVTAVGGTNLLTTVNQTNLDSAYVGENSAPDPIQPVDFFGTGGLLSGGFYGSGGGVSRVFAKPVYQNLLPTMNGIRRTLPDIAMHMGGCPGMNSGIVPVNPCADPKFQRSGVFTILNGVSGVAIGTSASAPEFAGVVALLNQKMGGRLGNINPYIYKLAAQQVTAGGPRATGASLVFHRQIQGNNGLFVNKTILPYSYVLGVGTPLVSHFLGLPLSTPLAGEPQSPSNP